MLNFNSRLLYIPFLKHVSNINVQHQSSGCADGRFFVTGVVTVVTDFV